MCWLLEKLGRCVDTPPVHFLSSPSNYHQSVWFVMATNYVHIAQFNGQFSKFHFLLLLSSVWSNCSPSILKHIFHMASLTSVFGFPPFSLVTFSPDCVLCPRTQSSEDFMSLLFLLMMTSIFMALGTRYTIPKFVSLAQVSEFLDEIQNLTFNL